MKMMKTMYYFLKSKTAPKILKSIFQLKLCRFLRMEHTLAKIKKASSRKNYKIYIQYTNTREWNCFQTKHIYLFWRPIHKKALMREAFKWLSCQKLIKNPLLIKLSKYSPIKLHKSTLQTNTLTFSRKGCFAAIMLMQAFCLKCLKDKRDKLQQLTRRPRRKAEKKSRLSK